MENDFLGGSEIPIRNFTKNDRVEIEIEIVRKNRKKRDLKKKNSIYKSVFDENVIFEKPNSKEKGRIWIFDFSIKKKK